MKTRWCFLTCSVRTEVAYTSAPMTSARQRGMAGDVCRLGNGGHGAPVSDRGPYKYLSAEARLALLEGGR
jgi:hypothetical protein